MHGWRTLPTAVLLRGDPVCVAAPFVYQRAHRWAGYGRA